MRVFGDGDSAFILVVIALILGFELIARGNSGFLSHQWRSFEWIFLAILAVWWILRKRDS